jgi:hypothetical protein
MNLRLPVVRAPECERTLPVVRAPEDECTVTRRKSSRV